jgi:hypothetical protein
LKKIIFLIFIVNFSCTTDQEIVYKLNKSRFYSLSKIEIDSTEIFRNDRDNDLNVEVRYQARVYNTLYDSIKWEFPEGTPNKISGVSEADVIYNKYGVYDANMILLKYDTLNYGNVRLLLDTIPLTNNLNIKFKEKNWSSYETDSNWSTIGSYITYTNMNSISDNNNPIEIKTNFNGFENKRVRLKFDYKIALNNPFPNSSYTNSQKKFELKIDNYTKFTLDRIENDKYFTAYLDLLDKDAFEVKFLVYPSLVSSDWIIVNNSTNIPMYSYTGPNQENFLIGYSDFSTTSSITIELNDLSYGSNDMENLKLSDTTKIIIPKGKNKILINLDDGLPTSFKIFKEGSRVTATSLVNNEYYYKLFIKNLVVETFQK